MEPAILLSTITAVGAVVIWALRLEGRINLVTQRTDALSEDVRYIRERIDTALNGRVKT